MRRETHHLGWTQDITEDFEWAAKAARAGNFAKAAAWALRAVALCKVIEWMRKTFGVEIR
jgi:hypothetical protein